MIFEANVLNLSCWVDFLSRYFIQIKKILEVFHCVLVLLLQFIVIGAVFL